MEEDNKGYFIMERGLFESPIFKDQPFSEREAWLWLKDRACYKPNIRRYKSKLITLSRGQVGTSFRQLSQTFRWGNERVNRYIQMLKDAGMITTDSSQGITIITICNYNKYDRQTTRHTEKKINTDNHEKHPQPGTQSETNPNTQTDTQSGTIITKELKKLKRESPPLTPQGEPSPSHTTFEEATETHEKQAHKSSVWESQPIPEPFVEKAKELRGWTKPQSEWSFAKFNTHYEGKYCNDWTVRWARWVINERQDPPDEEKPISEEERLENARKAIEQRLNSNAPLSVNQQMTVRLHFPHLLEKMKQVMRL